MSWVDFFWIRVSSTGGGVSWGVVKLMGPTCLHIKNSCENRGGCWAHTPKTKRTSKYWMVVEVILRTTLYSSSFIGSKTLKTNYFMQYNNHLKIF